MPKGKIQLANKKIVRVRSKFKLGNRKNTTSALSLTTARLLELFQHPSMNKDRQKIVQVLNKRGVNDIPAAIDAAQNSAA